MKALVIVKKEVDVKYLQISMPVRYDDEDISYNFPLRDGDIWAARIDLDEGKIIDWPKGKTGRLAMKVCDEGTYELLDENDFSITQLEDYVPNSLLPGEYGDYIDLEIDTDGRITNWYQFPSLKDFFPED